MRQSSFFWDQSPGGLLMGAAMVSLSISTYLARCVSCSPHFFPFFTSSVLLSHIRICPPDQLLAQGRAGRAAGDGPGPGGVQAHAPVDLDLLPPLVVHPGGSMPSTVLTGSALCPFLTRWGRIRPRLRPLASSCPCRGSGRSRFVWA